MRYVWVFWLCLAFLIPWILMSNRVVQMEKPTNRFHPDYRFLGHRVYSMQELKGLAPTQIGVIVWTTSGKPMISYGTKRGDWKEIKYES